MSDHDATFRDQSRFAAGAIDQTQFSIPTEWVDDPAFKPATGVDATLNERGERYGKFVDHAALSQNLKATMKSHAKWHCLDPDQREALEMIQHKIARIINGDCNYHDSWHDITGYAKLVADRLEGVER